MPRGNVRVSITGDADGLNRATARAQANLASFGNKGSKSLNLLKTAAAGAGVALGVGLVAGAKQSIKAASDLSEQVNKTRVVFRGSEKDILRWSKNTAQALGISRREALEAAGVFGNMLVPMGFARKRAGEMSKVFVGLASDMASFNNASPQETLDALRAGLAGETEPLRRFGVFLNDARLKQEALNLGLKDAIGPTGALTASAKAQATYSVILKDTADAQGDFERTSKSVANQQRILRAEIENLTAKLGKALLPVVADVLGKLTKFVNQMQTGKGPGGDFADVMGDIADAAKDTAKFLGPPLKAIGEFSVKHPAVAAMAVALGAFAKAYGGLTGGGAGKLGNLGRAVGLMKPVPVVVTNPGFGGGGKGVPPVVGAPGGGGGGGTAGRVGRALRWVPIIGTRGNVIGLGLTAVTVAAAEHLLPDNNVGRSEGQRRATQTPSGQAPAIPGQEGADARQRARLQASQRQHAEWARSVQRDAEKASDAYMGMSATSRQAFHASSRELTRLRKHTSDETGRIRRRFGEDTDKGRQALAENYRKAAQVARSQMESTGRVTKAGLSFVRRMMVNELRMYGLSEESIRFRLEGKEQSGKTIDAPLVGKQSGGMVVPGSGSGDKVHMQAMVEPGEEVFVLNRNATAALQSLQAMNQMVPRFQGGGLLELLHPGNDPAGHGDHLHVAAPPRRIVALGRRLQRLGWNVSEHPAFGGVNFQHAPNSFHYSGRAIDVNWPNAGQERAKIAALLPMLQGLMRMARAIRAPRVRGRGPLRDILQSGLDTNARAANRRLNQLLNVEGAEVGMTGGGSAANQAIGRRLAAAYGWTGGQWSALLELWNRESGWNNMARNPSSGAFGIPQALPPSKMPAAAQRGDARSQIRWGLNYIRGRYGSPSGALSFHNTHGWYRRGGLVRRQGGGWANPLESIRPYNRFVRRRKRQAQREQRRIRRRQSQPLPGWTADAYLQSLLETTGAQQEADFGLAALLTPGDTSDDLAAATAARDFWSAQLSIAQASGDPNAVNTVLGQINRWQGSIDTLNEATNTQNDLVQQQIVATEAHTAAVAEQTTQMKRNEDLIRAQGPALTSALLQMINGGIGGNAGLGRMFPSSVGLGGLARA